MALRGVIADVESILVAERFSRAADNFTPECLPASIAHKSYTLGRLELRPRYLGSDAADYLGAHLPILIALRVHGSHNPSGSLAEAYLQAVDAFEQLEDALVDEDSAVAAADIQPLLGAGEQEFLLLSITLSMSLLRTREE